MPSALLIDLRERVVTAMAEGASCHSAATRFGSSASRASRWAGSTAGGPGRATATRRRSASTGHRGAREPDPRDRRGAAHDLPA